MGSVAGAAEDGAVSAQEALELVGWNLPADGARHPARFSTGLLAAIRPLVADCTLILDPFAGTGRVHCLGVPSVGGELEPEWAALHPRTIVANALCLPFTSGTFDGIVTSPTYGNRMADHHDARDASRRNTYRHALGRPLHPENSGAMQWGPAYREFHQRAWREAARVLASGALFVLNVSDHIRAGERMPVTDFHIGVLRELLGSEPHVQYVSTPRQRFGANGGARVEGEAVIAFRKRS